VARPVLTGPDESWTERAGRGIAGTAKGMSLTAEEREKFAAYLEQNARDTEKLVQQLLNLPAGRQMATRYEKEAEASRIIADKLRNTQSQEIK